MRRRTSPPHESAGSPRPSRRIHAEVHGKLPELAHCESCDASYRNGRWTWEPAPADSYPATCPACERAQSQHPAGVLRAEGGFAVAHRDELAAMLRNVAESESAEHPLNRIMDIETSDLGLVITTTSARLAVSLGRALARAYGGSLDQPGTSAEQDALVRVGWVRD